MEMSMPPIPPGEQAAAGAHRASFRLGHWLGHCALCCALLLPRPGLAQSSLTNGDFAHDLSSWWLQRAPSLNALWVDEDRNGAADSGAAAILVTRAQGDEPEVALTQCLALAGVGFPLPARASARVESHDAGALHAVLLLQEFGDTACQRAIGPAQPRLINAGRPIWSTLHFDYQPSARGIGSLQVSLAIIRSAGREAEGRVLFDDLQCGIPPRRSRLRSHVLAEQRFR
jgi:hypothetical protein